MKTSQKLTKETELGLGQIRLPSFPSFASVKPSPWESEINARVARLYGLTPEEIQLVESASVKTSARQGEATRK